MAGHGTPGRKIGNGEGHGTGDLPTTIRGIAVQGSDDFYVQKLDRNPGDTEYEAMNGPMRGPCFPEDDD